MPITIDQARVAKDAAKKALSGIPGIVGIGLTKIGKDYALKVNLRARLPADVEIPDRIEGVRVSTEVVGDIRKRSKEE